MNHGSLFSGIGGFDIAAEWMGWNNLFHCEINPFGIKILKHYWPDAESFADITKTDFKKYANRIDVLTGGFPCQDASNANQHDSRGSGLNGKRTGLLFHKLRSIGEIKPLFVVAENVANILKTNNGRDFGIILSELASMGYNAEWRVCYASEVGAPHHRGRVYLVAYSNSIRIKGNKSFFSLLQKKIKPISGKIKGTDVEINTNNYWLGESPVYNVVNGVPKGLAEYIRAGGNSIVPQVAYSIFKQIETIIK